MSDPRTPKLTAFQRTEIQMEAVVPLVRDLQRVLGEDVVLEALRERVRLQVADAERRPRGEGRVEDVAKGFAYWADGGALEYETRELNADRASVDVTRCAYQRMMKRLDALDLGPSLICSQDYPMATRLGLELTRTQTCMEGASHCDFRYGRLTSS